MSKPKVAILHTVYADLSIEKEVAEQEGCELAVIGVPSGTVASDEQMIELGKDADALYTVYAKVSENVLAACKNAKGIVRNGIGFDNIDVKAATKLGIPVANVPDYCFDEVSDHAIALSLALVRGVGQFDKMIRKGTWNVEALPPLLAPRIRTFGLLGFGNIPKYVARKVQAFGYKVIAFDPFVKQETADEFNVKMVDLETLFKESDVLSVHAPLTEDTKHVVNAEHLKMMKKTAFVVNTSRGPLVDEAALYTALSEGWIAGAGLDVMESEPPKADNPLLKLDNIILTPHAAYSSDISVVELRKRSLTAACKMAKGEKPKAWVNRRDMEAAGTVR